MAKDDKSTYYDAGGIEVLEVIKAKLTPEQLEGYFLGNAIKYALRANFKGNWQRDLEKMANYAGWLKEHHERPIANDDPGQVKMAQGGRIKRDNEFDRWPKTFNTPVNGGAQ